jgi:hypothetical protein
MPKKISPDLSCTVRLDRIQIGGDLYCGHLPDFPQYEVRADRFVRTSLPIRAYNRLRTFNNLEAGPSLGIQYDTPCGWLHQAKSTLIAPKAGELLRPEINEIFRAFRAPRILLAEIAFDFSLALGIDSTFIREHAMFGKSRLRNDNRYDTVTYGGRRSDKFVRAYLKPELNCYRVELELHTSWLHSRNFLRPEDLGRLSEDLTSHISFVTFDWNRLESFLRRREGQSAERILQQVHSRSYSLHRALRFLRRSAGFSNTHRILKPLRINRDINRSLRTWSKRWAGLNVH